jgi:hypothetical protein
MLKLLRKWPWMRDIIDAVSTVIAGMRVTLGIWLKTYDPKRGRSRISLRIPSCRCRWPRVIGGFIAMT